MVEGANLITVAPANAAIVLKSFEFSAQSSRPQVSEHFNLLGNLQKQFKALRDFYRADLFHDFLHLPDFIDSLNHYTRQLNPAETSSYLSSAHFSSIKNSYAVFSALDTFITLGTDKYNDLHKHFEALNSGLYDQLKICFQDLILDCLEAMQYEAQKYTDEASVEFKKKWDGLANFVKTNFKNGVQIWRSLNDDLVNRMHPGPAPDDTESQKAA